MKIYFIRIRNIVAVLMIVLLVACEEVIDIDLNSSNPVLVAEGVIDNESPAWIRLSYTTDYFETEEANVEQEATVIISDNAGHTESLEYVSDGIYKGKNLVGSFNNQYTVTIYKDVVKYEASSTLFPQSEILSVSFEENENKKPGQDETQYNITIIFKDDPSSKNYYLLKYVINGEVETDSYYLVDDDYYENTGKIEYSPFRLNFDLGDKIVIQLYSIDEDTFIYYSEMNDDGGGMRGSSTPYSPKSNFGSDVLGYFTAWSKVEYSTTVE